MKKTEFVTKASILFATTLLILCCVAFFLFWNNPKLLRYRAYFPHDIVFSGMGKSYNDAQYWDVSIQLKGVWLGDNFRPEPLDKDVPLRFLIKEEVISFNEMRPDLLTKLGFKNSPSEIGGGYSVYSLGGGTNRCSFEFDSNNELIDFYVYGGWLDSNTLQRPKRPVVQLSWREGEWFSLPILSHDELTKYIDEPEHIEKSREID